MKRLLRVLGLLCGLVLLGYFIGFVRDAFEASTLERFATFPAAAAILFAALCYSAIIPMAGWAWRMLLVDGSRRWSTWELTSILGISQIAKYVPGNIAQHAGRMALAVGRGMRVRHYISSVGVETALALAAALLVGAACIQLSGGGPTKLSLPWLPTSPWLPSVVAGLALLVPFAVGALGRIAPRFISENHPAGWIRAIPKTTAQLQAMAAYCTNYLLIGAGFLLIAKVMAPTEDFGYASLTAAFALSWLVGFLSPGMPAGMGVREGVMALMLSGENDGGAVLVVVLAMRFATIVGDLLWFFLGSAAVASLKDNKA